MLAISATQPRNSIVSDHVALPEFFPMGRVEGCLQSYGNTKQFN